MIDLEDRRSIGREELVAQLKDVGVEGGAVLLVHTSFRAVRPVEGGPAGLVDALRAAIGNRGTLVMPSWSGRDDEVFDPATDPADADLGILPDIFWRQSGVLRADHAFSFAAVGPAASQILADPLPLPPHRPESPVGRVRELGGQVLLLGVDHDADTTIHLAEIVAGVPYRTAKYITILQDGRPTRLDYGENDHCCARFRLVDGWLRDRGLQQEGRLGHARARLARSRDIVDVVVVALQEDPLLFLHPPGECSDCDETRATVPT